MMNYPISNLNNFKNLFLQLLILILNNQNKDFEKENLFDKNNLRNKYQDIIFMDNEHTQKYNELIIAKKLTEKYPNNILGGLSENSERFIKRIINEFNYNIRLILSKLNEHIKLEKVSDNNITIFDIFCFSLLCLNSNQSLLNEIKTNFLFIYKWLESIIKVQIIYDTCQKIEMFKEFINGIESTFNKNKYYVKYINKNGIDKFIELNGKNIIYKGKKNNLINENIYCFLSEKNLDDLYISEKTELYEYIIDNSLFEPDTPISFFGKLMEKKDNDYVILSNSINQIIFLNDKENIMKNININEFNYYYGIKIIDKNKYYIYLETSKISEIKEKKVIENYESSMDLINKNVLIKFNIIDYKNNENYYDSISFIINNNININITINNNNIYYVYKENEIQNEYFPQKIKLYNEEKFSYFTLLMYKGYCNEINTFINYIGGFAYEYYYECKYKNILPEPLKIKLGNKFYDYNNFWKFETEKRYKITFMNIPNQGTNIQQYNSFLKILTYSDNKKYFYYGTFLLEKLSVVKLKKININNDFKEFIKDIESDVESFMKDESDEDFLKNKYLIDKDIEKYLNEFNYDYRGYYFPDEIEYFNYFNNMCIWNILVNVLNENWNIIFETYFNNLNIIKNSKLNYTEKTTLLITIIRRLLETKNGTEPQIFPRIIFFDQINEIDKCYKEAYEFHLKLIDSLTEDSILIQPFLQLDSYIMEMILTDNDINLIKTAQKKKYQPLIYQIKKKKN